MATQVMAWLAEDGTLFLDQTAAVAYEIKNAVTALNDQLGNTNDPAAIIATFNASQAASINSAASVVVKVQP